MALLTSCGPDFHVFSVRLYYVHFLWLELNLLPICSKNNGACSSLDGKPAKPKKKTHLTKKKKKKKGSDDEAFEDSDDGDFEGQEVDYMSDGSDR